MAEDPDTDGRAKLSGVDRVLAILKSVAEHSSGVSLAQLSELSGAPKPSVHRALAALRRAGFVEQDASDSRYHLGFELVRLVFAFHENLDERVLVDPVLDELASRFSETIHYARLDGAEVVYLAKVTPRDRNVQMTSVVGGRNPAHCTGVGKVLLAQVLPDDAAVVDYVRRHGPLESRTSHTMTDAAALAADLAATRQRGFGLDREESEVGVVCIAFPVDLGLPSLGPAAVSISALAFRTEMDELIAAAPEIRGIIAPLNRRSPA
jgi:IclR family acetate operon transcriptional repressor